MKRLAISAIAVLTLAIGLPSEVAAAGGGATIVTTWRTFTIPVGQCQFLPATASVDGSGTEKSITTVRTANGITTIENSTHTSGTATDDLDNRYVFNYSNSFRISNTVANQGVYSGLMTDAFSLAGNGPAQLHNGFVAGLTTTDPVTFAYVTWYPRSSHGDPISFDPGAIVSHCDPL